MISCLCVGQLASWLRNPSESTTSTSVLALIALLILLHLLIDYLEGDLQTYRAARLFVHRSNTLIF